MLVPEKGNVSSCTALGVATHFGVDFGFDECRFIKLLATAKGVLVSVNAGPKILLEKEPSAGARCDGVLVIAWSPKKGASATQERSPTPKAPPKAKVTKPVEDSPTRSCVPARNPFRIVGAGLASPYSNRGGAAHWTEVFGGRCHLLLQSTSQGVSL